jgi:uncharacterized protein YbjT (DUF2867 family)
MLDWCRHTAADHPKGTDMNEVLVTGATGTVGVVLVDRLRASGIPVRALSRTTEPGLVTGDLASGVGIDRALEGVGTVVHLATTYRDDSGLARTLVRAAAAAGHPHVVLLSIVGIDRIPLPYYRGKLAAESVVAESGLPHTILRSTQFHTLVERILSAQRWSPVLLTPAFRLQPIDAGDVATRLAELALSDPAGRVADIGGPEVRDLRSFAEVYQTAAGSRRPISAMRLPGATFRAFRAGANLVPGPPFGTVTFEQHLTGSVAARDR